MSIWKSLFGKKGPQKVDVVGKNAPGSSPALKLGGISIHSAAKSGDLESFKSMLESNPGLVCARNEHGATPLHYAGNKDVANLLLIKMADVNSRNNNGAAPLHYAASEGRIEVAQLLLENGANVNAKDQYGWTPLHKAASCCQTALVKLLLASGADVNAKCEDTGWTPLHGAKFYLCKDVAELLRQHGGHE